MTDTYGWAIVNGGGYTMLSVFGRRVEAIADFLAAMDQSFGSEPTNAQALNHRQYKAWRRWKHNYGTRCIRVRITPAFGDAP